MPHNKDMQELVDLFNSMLGKAQGALEGYNAVRSEYQQALGDDSCLAELQTRLASLSGHCLTNLGTGLTAMTRGDLVAVQPVTTPLDARAGRQAGAGIFNEMLAKARRAA